MKMNSLVQVLFVCGATSFLSAQTAKEATHAQLAAQVQQLYNAGVTAMQAGDVTKAEQCFQTILQRQPGHSYARYRLSELRVNHDAILRKNREKQFAAVMIPQVDFADATLQDALNALSIIIGKQTEQKLVPNFIINDPDRKLSEKTFTLKLVNMPANAVLHYIMQNTGAQLSYEMNATVIKP